MVPGKWCLQGRLDRGVVESLGWTSGVEDVEDSEEDHVAGLVERIALTMLEDDDEETQRTGGWRGSLLPQLQAQSAAQVFASDWDKRMESMKALSGLPEPVQKRIESEAMELLYTELARLKMEELAAAQQQLSFYQNAFVDSRQSSHPAYTSSGLSNFNASMLGMQHGSLSNTFHNKQLHRCSGGVDWSAANIMQCCGNKRCLGQGAGAPLMYPTASYLTRTTLLGMPVSRESGGTGVFLPRSRTGARNLRTHDSRRKSEFKFAVPAGRHDTFLPDKAKDKVGEKPSLQYPLCSPLQEVAPDISLPSEWTY